MGSDDYVIDENGSWGTKSDALVWYRREVKRLNAEIAAKGIHNSDIPSEPESIEQRNGRAVRP